MSTHAHIGLKNPDGTVTYIGTHFDGYPKHHGPILVGHYPTEAHVRALVALGDLSVLREEVGEKHSFDDDGGRNKKMCMAYGRDRGEEETEARTVLFERFLDVVESYTYLFTTEEGWIYREGRGEFRPLAPDVEDDSYGEADDA